MAEKKAAEGRKLSEEELELLRKKTMLPEKYNFELLSTTSSVEPYYFWLIDFMKNALKFEPEKIEEQMGASVVSGFFGEMAVRREKLEDQGMKYIGTINTVVKSIINLLYDLREFDRRLAIYDDLHSEDSQKTEAADLGLRRIWMDEVDIRKGGASINNLSATRGLEFVTLRDAFMMAKNLESIETMDLNDRVKRILKGRVEEYLKWMNESEKELRQRRKIELVYLKAQVESLRLYTIWARPYLKAAQMLQFKDAKSTDPNLVQAFDQNYVEITIRGTKKYHLKEFLSPAANKYSYSPPEMLTPSQQAELKRARAGPYAIGMLELKFIYRARPWLMYNPGEQQRHYANLGKMNIEFRAFAMRPDEYELMKRYEEIEALKFIEGITKESLEALREDIERYIGELDKEKKKEKEKQMPMLDKIFFGTKSEGKKGGSGALAPMFGGEEYFLEERAKAITRKRIYPSFFDLYDIFKKAHGILSFPYPPDWGPPEKPAK